MLLTWAICAPSAEETYLSSRECKSGVHPALQECESRRQHGSPECESGVYEASYTFMRGSVEVPLREVADRTPQGCGEIDMFARGYSDVALWSGIRQV